MEKKGSGALLRNLAILLVLALVGTAGFFFILDGSPAVLTLTPEGELASYGTDFSLRLKSKNSPLKSVAVAITQDGKRMEFLQRTFTNATMEHTEVFRLPRESGFKDGPVELAIEARVNSWLAFMGRGKSSIVKKLTLDLTPPRLNINSGIHNVNQGGSGAVSFTVSKPVDRAGVAVGELFFPAFQQKGGEFVCFFAMPLDMPPSSFRPKVLARDKAGNEVAQSLHIFAIPKAFKSDKLNVPDSFLESKMSQYTAMYPKAKTPLEIYKVVNSELRQQNVEQLKKVALDTAPVQLWSGAFLRLPNSAGRANFGDARDYYYDNEKIDHQTHMGVDLASVANAPVPAANTGKVVFADFFGIYGNCIIIDHGLGLQSLYSHLDAMDVQKGQEVQKGQIIGKTGTTGLAGGDHLHFGMVVHGIQVSPIEWWDEHWIKDNVQHHLTPGK